MTLKEYLVDYASEKTQKVGDEMIEKELLNIPNEKIREIVRQNLKKIAEKGLRDFYF